MNSINIIALGFTLLLTLFLTFILSSIALSNMHDSSAILAGVMVILSVTPLLYPRVEVCRVIGMAMVLMGIIMWFLVAGGLTWGSVLAIVGGSYLFDWRSRD